MADAAAVKLATLNIQCDPELRGATEDYIADFNGKNESRVSLRSTTESALRLFLREKGFWPRKKTGAARPGKAVRV